MAVCEDDSAESCRHIHFACHNPEFAEALKDALATEFLDDHRALEPPDPIPNSAVKRCIADGSVELLHVRVGHRQDSNPEPLIALRSGVLLCAR